MSDPNNLNPAMPYQTRELVVGAGEGKPVLIRADTNAFLTDDEVRMLAYVRYLEAEAKDLREQLATARECVTVAELLPPVFPLVPPVAPPEPAGAPKKGKGGKS